MARLLATLWLMIFAAALPAAAATNPDAVAVIIGNKNYLNAPPVEFADRDALAIRHYVIDVLGYDAANVIMVENATFARMIELFGTEKSNHKQLARRLGATAADSDVFVYFSGHGFPGVKDQKGYLLPTDADPRDAEATGYSLDLLTANLAALGARSVTVVLDACFTGNTPSGWMLTDKSVVVRALDPAPPQPHMTVLAASGSNEMANWDRADRHGAFTEFFLRAVYGAANDAAYGDRADGRITAAQVKRYLDHTMSRWTARELDAEQTASLSGEPGMVLATLRPGAMPQRWQPPEEARGGTAPAGAAPEIPAPLPAPVPAPVPVAMPRPAPPPAPGAPAATAPPVAAGVDLRSIAELLQAELRRVGCYAGPVDGSWGRSSAEAVQRFNERTRSSLDAAAPGLDAVKAVSERAARVCPLSCPTGQTADGDHCVAVLPVRARPAAPPPPAPAAPQGAGQKCSVFAGMRYCE